MNKRRIGIIALIAIAALILMLTNIENALTFGTLCATLYLGYVANSQNKRLVLLEENRQAPLIDIKPIAEPQRTSQFDFMDLSATNKDIEHTTFFFECRNLSDQYVTDTQLLRYKIELGNDAIFEGNNKFPKSINSQITARESKFMKVTLPFSLKSYPLYFDFDFLLTIVGGQQYHEHVKFNYMGLPALTDKSLINNKVISINKLDTKLE